jgi:hypothetical protein
VTNSQERDEQQHGRSKFEWTVEVCCSLTAHERFSFNNVLARHVQQEVVFIDALLHAGRRAFAYIQQRNAVLAPLTPNHLRAKWKSWMACGTQ